MANQPLVMRLYFHPQYTSLVRLIGHENLTLPDAQKRIKPLVKKYGREKVEQVAAEIVEYDHSHDPPIVRLTEHVKSLVFPIIGRPGSHASRDAAQSPATDARAGPSEPAPIAARLTRKTAIARYADWLKESGKAFVVVDDARRALFAEVDLSHLDFIVHDEPYNILVTVRRSLRCHEREAMQRWQEVFSDDYQAVRVWPVKSENGWIWREHAIEPPRQ